MSNNALSFDFDLVILYGHIPKYFAEINFPKDMFILYRNSKVQMYVNVQNCVLK